MTSTFVEFTNHIQDMEPDETLHCRVTLSPSHKYILPLGSSKVVGVVIIPTIHNIVCEFKVSVCHDEYCKIVCDYVH